MKQIFLLFALLLCLVGCTNENKAYDTLHSNGYDQITFTGYDWLACGKGDFYATGFRARNRVTGGTVTGTVCQGLLKGSTIRFD